MRTQRPITSLDAADLEPWRVIDTLQKTIADLLEALDTAREYALNGDTDTAIAALVGDVTYDAIAKARGE